MKKCVLFTDSYPYGFKESFLETEITFLSKAFDVIYIFSLSFSEKIRTVPKNVYVFSLHVSDMRFRHIKKILSGIVSHGMKIDRHNLFDVFQCIYFRGGVNFSVNKAKRIIAKNNIDLDGAVFYTYWAGFLSCVAIRLCESLQKNCVIVSRAHAVDLYDYRQKRGFSPFQNYIVRNLTSICPISNDGKQYLINKYPNFTNKIRLHRLGTLDCGLNPLSETRSFNVVSCSNIIPLKRTPLILNSLVLASKSIPSIRWYCFGDGECLNQLKKAALDLKFSDQVSFFGRIDNSAILDFYKNNKVDLFINLSEVEGLPVSIMEAMSFGIPCLATDVGGTKEIVNDVNGFLLPKNINESDVAKKIIEYCNLSNESKQEKRTNARNFWLKNYDSNLNYDNWCRFLLSLIECEK